MRSDVYYLLANHYLECYQLFLGTHAINPDKLEPIVAYVIITKSIKLIHPEFS